jgi:hypothetical protein
MVPFWRVYMKTYRCVRVCYLPFEIHARARRERVRSEFITIHLDTARHYCHQLENLARGARDTCDLSDMATTNRRSQIYVVGKEIAVRSGEGIMIQFGVGTSHFIAQLRTAPRNQSSKVMLVFLS